MNARPTPEEIERRRKLAELIEVAGIREYGAVGRREYKAARLFIEAVARFAPELMPEDDPQ